MPSAIWKHAHRAEWAQSLGLEMPILLAPMAGAGGVAMAVGVAKTGALGALPCGMLSAEQLHEQASTFRAAAKAPLNLNFFCHTPPADADAQQSAWRDLLDVYYKELEVEDQPLAAPSRRPFDAPMCEAVEAVRPEVVSFHFGLPDAVLLDRIKATGALVLSSATTVREAQWLEAHGCDVIIAQGIEAGGHRAQFLDDDLITQLGTMALVPLIVDAVRVPVVAAGGIMDGRGIAAAMLLGASAVQMGSAYLKSEESLISPLHRGALQGDVVDTAITNLFSGKPARGVVNRLMRELGPMSSQVPPYPTAGSALIPLKGVAEKQGADDFSSLWAGQSAALAREGPAEALTRQWAHEALSLLFLRV